MSAGYMDLHGFSIHKLLDLDELVDNSASLKWPQRGTRGFIFCAFLWLSLLRGVFTLKILVQGKARGLPDHLQGSLWSPVAGLHPHKLNTRDPQWRVFHEHCGP